MKNIRISYVVIALITLAVAALGSFFTSKGMAWYQTIALPEWTPDGGVIGAVWTIIFILTAVSAMIVWRKGDRADWKFTHSIRFFALNAILNAMWSLVFFTMHWIGTAVWVAALLALTVYLLIFMIWSISRTASLLLVPYALWATFATFLTYRVFLLN